MATAQMDTFVRAAWIQNAVRYIAHNSAAKKPTVLGCHIAVGVIQLAAQPRVYGTLPLPNVYHWSLRMHRLLLKKPTRFTDTPLAT